MNRYQLSKLGRVQNQSTTVIEGRGQVLSIELNLPFFLPTLYLMYKGNIPALAKARVFILMRTAIINAYQNNYTGNDIEFVIPPTLLRQWPQSVLNIIAADVIKSIQHPQPGSSLHRAIYDYEHSIKELKITISYAKKQYSNSRLAKILNLLPKVADLLPAWREEINSFWEYGKYRRGIQLLARDPQYFEPKERNDLYRVIYNLGLLTFAWFIVANVMAISSTLVMLLATAVVGNFAFGNKTFEPTKATSSTKLLNVMACIALVLGLLDMSLGTLLTFGVLLGAEPLYAFWSTRFSKVNYQNSYVPFLKKYQNKITEASGHYKDPIKPEDNAFDRTNREPSNLECKMFRDAFIMGLDGSLTTSNLTAIANPHSRSDKIRAAIYNLGAVCVALYDRLTNRLFHNDYAYSNNIGITSAIDLAPQPRDHTEYNVLAPGYELALATKYGFTCGKVLGFTANNERNRVINDALSNIVNQENSDTTNTTPRFA